MQFEQASTPTEALELREGQGNTHARPRMRSGSLLCTSRQGTGQPSSGEGGRTVTLSLHVAALLDVQPQFNSRLRSPENTRRCRRNTAPGRFSEHMPQFTQNANKNYRHAAGEA